MMKKLAMIIAVSAAATSVNAATLTSATTASDFFNTSYDSFSGTLTGDVATGFTGTLDLTNLSPTSGSISSLTFTLGAGTGDVTSVFTADSFSCTFTGSSPQQNSCLSSMGQANPVAPHGPTPPQGPIPGGPGSSYPNGGQIWLDDSAVNGDILIYWSRSNGAFDQFDTYTYSTTSEVPVPAAAWLFGSALVGLVGIGRKRRIA